MHRIHRALLATVPVLTMCLAASAQEITSQDRKFIADAAKGGITEVRMGKLGLAQGSSDSVKMFSQQLADDHAKGNKQLAELAAKKNVTLPAEASPGPAEQMLAKHTGAGFDQNYIKAMIADHQKDIQEFEKEVSSGSDPEVKQWASDTLPTLRSHLEQAKALATPMPGTK